MESGDLTPLVWTQSFGCQMNEADSQEMGLALQARGFQQTPELNEADVVLVNTCTVRQHAEDRAFSFVGRLAEWKEEKSNRLLIIAGCAAERTKENLQKRFPYVDLVVGAKSIEQFPQLIDTFLNSHVSQRATHHASRNTSSYVTIMRGCNYSCSYCIVPFVRGRESYRAPETILREVQEKTEAGVREIIFLGQTVNSYYSQDWNFSRLLREISKIAEVKRIRFMSPHPYYVSEDLAETIAALPKIARHIHLPLQSGSNRILSLMKRNYTREKYLSIVEMLRAQIPDIAITTDIIVGFPTESDNDFKETLALMEEIVFDSAYYFKYSSRQGTEAAKLQEQVPQGIKEERLAQVREASERHATERAKRHLGKISEVLFESETQGRTSTNHGVTLDSRFRGNDKGSGKYEVGSLTGKILPVEITSVKNRKLYGRLLADSDIVSN